VANQAIYLPFVLPWRYPLRRVCWANGGLQSGSIDVGIYSVNGGRIWSNGGVAAAGGNQLQYVTLASPVLLSPGRYYFAMAQSGNGTMWGCNADASKIRTAGLYWQASAYPLPASATFAAWTINFPVPIVALTGVASAEAFGAPTVTTGAVSIAPSGIGSAQTFGAARIAAVRYVLLGGIASGEAFGAPLAAIHLNLRPAGIASGQAFGQPRVRRKRTTTAVITPTGIVSRQAVGTPTLGRGAVTIAPVGIASAEAVGFGGIGRPVILPKVTGAANLPLMLVRRAGLRH
jgi:hypothetical protein